MDTSPRTFRLGGEDLGGHRHVCALFDGSDEAYQFLMPFIVEGLAQGDRVVHIVDPRARDSELRRLGETGMDLVAVMDSHQLEVPTWAESYLRGGRFDRFAQLAYIGQSLSRGNGYGFPVTRLIGCLDWAVETPTVTRDLLRYEARLDELLRRRSDVVICTYDLNRHSARTIAEVLGVHPVALVSGLLRTNVSAARPSARDRILAAALQLFYDMGIQATGVDSIIQAAGVAKATFYRHFPSKDDLVVAWLRDPHTRWLERVRLRVEAHQAEATEVIPLFFEVLADWLETEGYRGCPYLNSAAEITQLAHPARVVVTEYLQEVEDYLVDLVAAAGYRDARALGLELHVLTAGAMALAPARRSGAAALTARDAARRLLDGAERD
ncbi:MAG: hypothetical protein QOF11_1356 [Chloroflexota bacterium]|nr:hypothetical protein [Chloroflexota bacterium]